VPAAGDGPERAGVMPEPDDPPTFGPLLEVAGDAIALGGMDTLMHSHRSLLWSGPGTTGVSAPARAVFGHGLLTPCGHRMALVHGCLYLCMDKCVYLCACMIA